MKLAELISVATRKDWEAFEVVDFWRAWGCCQSLSLSVLLISAWAWLPVISSTVPQDCSAEGLTVDLKDLRSWLVFGRSQEQEKVSFLLCFLSSKNSRHGGFTTWVYL